MDFPILKKIQIFYICRKFLTNIEKNLKNMHFYHSINIFLFLFFYLIKLLIYNLNSFMISYESTSI